MGITGGNRNENAVIRAGVNNAMTANRTPATQPGVMAVWFVPGTHYILQATQLLLEAVMLA